MNVFETFAKLLFDSSDFDKGLDDAEQKSQSFGEKLGATLSKAGKIASGAISLVGAGVATLTKAFVEGVTDVASYGDEVDKASQKLGISAKAYQEWNAVMDYSGTSMSSMTMGFKTLQNAMDDYVKASGVAYVDQQELADAQIAYNEALLNANDAQKEYDAVVKKSGKGSVAEQKALVKLQKAQSNVIKTEKAMAKAAQGTKKEMSPAAKALQELGVSATDAKGNLRETEDVFNDVIAALQSMPDDAHRAALANDILGRSAQELAPVLNTSAEEVQALKDSVNEMGVVMSDDAVKASARFQDSITNVKNAVDGAKRKLLQEFLPVLSDVFDGITKLFGDDPDGGVELISKGLSEIVELIGKKTPEIVEGASKIVTKFLEGMIPELPGLIRGLADTTVGLLQNIITIAPDLVDALVDATVAIVNALAENAGSIVDSLVRGIVKLVNKLTEPDNLVQIVDSLTYLVNSLLIALLDAIPELLAAFWNGLVNILTAIINLTPTKNPKLQKILKDFGDWFSATWMGQAFIKLGEIWDTIKEWFENSIFGEAFNLGKGVIQNLIDGLKEKLKPLTDVFETIGSPFKSFGDKIKNFFGFKDPGEGEYFPKIDYDNDFNSSVHNAANDMQEYLNSIMNKEVLTDDTELNQTIVVQSVLDGRVIGETAYKYSRQMDRVYGGAKLTW